MGLHKLDDVVLGVAGLDDDLSLLVGAAGTARHLLQHVKGPLMAAEVREVDHRVGIEDAHDAHGVKVQPLVTIWVPTRMLVRCCENSSMMRS